MYEYINNSWLDVGYYQSDKQYFISVYPRPLYRVFVSRGLRAEDRVIEDRVIGDPIVRMIREWGFETVTVGVEVKVPEELVPQKVKEEIMKADALIAIATPRFLDALTGLWRTLEWLHGEVGVAFGVNKPLLILKDKRVSLGGLPSYCKSFHQLIELFEILRPFIFKNSSSEMEFLHFFKMILTASEIFFLFSSSTARIRASSTTFFTSIFSLSTSSFSSFLLLTERTSVDTFSVT